MLASHRLRLPSLLAAFAVLFIASCATPLGPGYTIEKQSLDVHYFAGDPPRVEVQARYRMKNTGNRSLSSVDVGLPDEQNYGRKNLRATIDGVAVSLSPASDRNDLRASFPRPWVHKEVHEFALEYELTREHSPDVGIAMTSDSLFLSRTGWYPVLRPPNGLFGNGGNPPKSFELTLRLPQGFLAHLSGRARGVRKQNTELVYRFRIGKDDDEIFIVAGRFFEQRFQTAGTTVVFWTLNGPLPVDRLASAGGHFATTLNEYEKDFGALGKNKLPYRIVALTSWPSSTAAGYPVIIARSFPRGAVLPALQASGGGGVGDRSLFQGDFAFAQSWFGEVAGSTFSPGASFSEELCFYATRFVAGESPNRGIALQNALRLFTGMQKQVRERTMPAMSESKIPAEKLFALAKEEMFFGALEDRCGPDNLRRALRQLVQSLRSSSYGYNELRSSLEQECHQDLGPMFRQWLTETGIPADFRQRYESRP